eukprot:CAMPEP_0113315134 /NCGR_PEP_ID=MMETSP0010_2-20120614/10924_1 /TAXON_ID=216773 ORGANISM="Corethron hystrix, Strain 308" /NCGR_SAMPLE_ID=MMETSP0010_2 /ASSEMBLY_ACC=CAM_ASM_000155 /LENGTH=336 /DNA_ID=CAMNT_0000171575 /DNA_START=112 /DNA_END=1123 /DNA_ORIENTATION=- /assembly_acc=CAM_ASM_000155
MSGPQRNTEQPDTGQNTILEIEENGTKQFTNKADDESGSTTCVESKDMEEKLNAMLSELSSEEVEGAALTSYVYWQEINKKDLDPSLLDSLRQSKALAMARRCLVGDKGDSDLAMIRLRGTLQWRKKKDIDGMRRCFYNQDAQHNDLRQGLEFSMSTGKQIVRGFDRKGRYVHLLVPRLKVDGDSVEGILAATVYTAERAIAATERRTEGNLEKFYVVFDYTGFEYKHSVSLAAAKAVVFALRDHYPERVQQIYLLDAPFVFQFFWNIIQPFIDPVTRGKIQFLSGDEKHVEFSNLFDLEQAIPCQLAGGKLSATYDCTKFMVDVPFDCAYDEYLS